ncbi:cell division septation protein DedD [Hydrogenophaga palleronii]|uniref:Cell division septation protein DedD n=1 Tax=Hydrogenophaga palleronii TaxID=65655 RepID=A0ABU1WRK0_9BURK|nr:SPOR domain-containing protein [Hydrogenophaga palleronii]MDR7151935.1 cell division septation protein DedD [Hydrogenophaga palleronii]
MFAQPTLEDHSTIRLAQNAANNPTAALYRAALGTLNTPYYLALFERFDAAGRASLVWNTAAGLCTVNWLAFRGLWGAALVYLAAAEGLALLVLGVGRQYLQWPLGVEMGVLGSLLMLSILVPGLYGNALLHADIRRRMASAVTDAHTVREACEALERQAPTQRRLKAFILGNALLGVLLLAAAAFIWTSEPAGTDTLPAQAVVPTQGDATPPEVSASLRPEPASPGEPSEYAEPVQPVQEAAVQSEPGPVQAPPQPAPDSPPSVLSAPAPKPSQPAQRATVAVPEAAPDRTPPPILVKPPPSVSHGINVGLFAEEANALKVHTQLTEAGLPATMQTVEGARGPRTRVRAGPFPDRATADAAAQRIRAMGLEAQIYRQ